ncbi:Protein of unknown function [Nakamurella panacisegetis]|uniref:DUF998 domain-containing protein n=1 Tax=Nakamurella panacisegetis TaxID=1090615 RepID=A0A1H0RZH2_9ACTN|nr:DUF998 domain-containing protein [Nakamurella panacisegetis]SDP34823.1 Protein of unknown function [Nakamurella panacisegetis]
MTGESIGDAAEDRAESFAVDLLDDEAHAPLTAIIWARRLAFTGIVGVVLAVLSIGYLHVAAPSRAMNPLSRTISEYALYPNGWIFSWGVVVLAVASMLVLAALVLREIVPWRSWGSLMTLMWSIGLIGLVVFPKQGFDNDPSVAGRVHWTWTLIAFFSLPIGTSLVCWHHRNLAGRWPRWALRLSMISGGWFIVLTLQTILSALTPIEAWRLVGLVERGLSLTEMAVVVVLGLWVWHDSGPAVVLDET